MESGTWSGRLPGRGLRRTLAVTTAVLFVAGVGSAYVRQETTPVSVDDAVRRFRVDAAGPGATSVAGVESGADGSAEEQVEVPGDGTGATPPTTSAPSGRPAAPGSAGGGPTPAGAAAPRGAQGQAAPGAGESVEDGVYVYATSGYESTDALGGSRHDYPSETAMTLRNTPCGWVQRWEPLAERWDESELCREGAAVAIRRFTTYHEFFQQGQEQQYTCPAGSHVARPAAVGEQWGWECAWESSRITTTVTYLGVDTLQIEGRAVQATRFLYESQLTGANQGTQRQERWLHERSGLNLRIKTDIQSRSQSPFGTVGYEEHYTITLRSLQPRR